jgi:hypothetical protein
MKKHKSKKSASITILLSLFVLIPVPVLVIDTHRFLENPFILLPLFVPTILVIWLYFDTYYLIDGQKLKYHSAFLNGEIEISQIREISKRKAIWIGIRPALSGNGLIIKFNRFDEIFIAPQNKEEMISDLLSINSKIMVV